MAAGDYRIFIDEDKCYGCGACIDVCPESLFELYENDYDETKAKIKNEVMKKIGEKIKKERLNNLR